MDHACARWAVVLALVLPFAACGDSPKGPTKVSGVVFPALEDDGQGPGLIELVDAEGVSALSQATQTILADAVAVDGSFGLFELDPSSPLILARATGGSIFIFTSSTEPADFVPFVGELQALFPTSRGRTHEIAVTALSHLAATMAIGLQATTGQSLSAASNEANAALSSYFGVGAGLDTRSQGGVALWSTAAGGVSALSGPVFVGLVTAALQQRVNAEAGLTDLVSYLDLLAKDAADGVVDGILHAPFVGGGAQALGATGYPASPFGADLADDMEAFLNSALNFSQVNIVTAQDLLDRLRLAAPAFVGGTQFGPAGVVLGGVPLVANVEVNVPATGQVQVTTGLPNVQVGARVFFGNVPSPAVTVVDPVTVVADIPAGITGTVFVTVVNPDGKRHSRLVTL